MQAKKMVRQRDCIRALKKKYAEDEARFQRQNAEITKEYVRIAQSYRELQLRFRNVAFTDFNAFREVWNLNERRLHDLVCKILEADRVVMQQQLGHEAKPTNPDYLKRWIIGTEEFEALTKTPQAPSQVSPDEAVIKTGSELMRSAILSEPLEHLRRLVTNEVGFLVDERVNSLLQSSKAYTTDEDARATIQLDVLLQELGVTDPDDVEQLLTHFLRDTEFGELESTGFVRPYQVLECLRKFVDAFHPNRQQNQMTLFNQISADATLNTSSEVARAILQLQVRMKRQMVPQRQFWMRKGDVVTEEMWRVWNACFMGQQRYMKELEERSKLILETDKLKQQNAELEMLLSRYLESDANDLLIYAPGQTVDFQKFD
jgi:dynein regulatory complex protein 1